MNYSEMVAALKSTEPEDYGTATTGMLLELMQYLQDQNKKAPNAALDSMAEAFKSHMIGTAQHRYSVERYFSGNGPIARKLKDYAAITRHFTMGCHKLEDKLAKFDFKPVVDVERGRAFRKWLESVALNAFAVKHPMAVASPYHIGIEIGLDTGIHTQQASYDPNQEPARYLVLSVELPNGMKVKYAVERHKHAQLLYYHPHEEVWLADSGVTIFEGVQEALAVEWEKLANQCGYTDKPIDVEAATKEILTKVDFIFDNEDRLPETTQYYVRNEDGQSSYMRFVMEEYIWIFMNTQGDWPSRESVLSINGGSAFNTKIEFRQMREFGRQEMIKIVQKGLDDMIKMLQPVIIIGEPEAPLLEDEKILAEAVTSPGIGEGEIPAVGPTPNYNPVWHAMQSVKKEKK